MIIKENYVSFKTAKLLKEKGFDGYCFMVYDIDCSIDFAMEFYGEIDICNSDCSEGVITAPSLQDAEKWLREKHNLYITIDSYATDKGIKYTYKIYNLERHMVPLLKAKPGFENHESACEDAINYCLTELI